MNFDQVYDMLNAFAEQINGQTNSVFDTVVTENIGSLSSESDAVQNTMQNTVDQGNLNGGLNIQSFSWPHRWDLQYDTTNDGRTDLLKQIYALQQADTSIERQGKLHGILSFMNTPANVAINSDGIQAIHDEAISTVNEKKAEISTLQDKITNDYDEFVRSLQTTLVSDNTENTELATSLFTADKSVLKTVASEPHPTQSYFELNKKVMDGFANSLSNNSAADLNMSVLTYNETKNYVNNTRNAVNEGLSLLAANEPTSTEEASTTERPLLAASAGAGMGNMNMSTNAGSQQADISQYIQGIFVKNTSGDMVNIVNRDDIIDTLQENQTRLDLNKDGIEDVVMWNQQDIRVKYSHPEKEPAKNTLTRLYKSPSFNTPNDITDETDRNGWISAGGSSFKIRDKYTAPQ